MTTTPEPRVVQVYLGERSYEIDIVDGQLAQIPSHMDSWLDRLSETGGHSHHAVIITDTNVRTPHAATVVGGLEGAGWRTDVIELEAGETAKRLDRVAGVYDKFVEAGADRSSVVVAVGGGVVGDTAGFVAATYARGVPFIQVPTTLLAQVDSSVGGKVGVNHAQAKNMIGAFYQPMGVMIDTATLQTLPDREFRAGMAEVIKYGVILDPEFFDYLEENVAGLNERSPSVMQPVISRCCRLKADIVEQDEYERTGLRAVLNYGHTFGHAFEALTNFGELLHGEAVAVGMLCASELAERRGLIGADVTARQRALLQAVGLPTELPDGISLNSDEVINRMKLDKKSVQGQLRFILPTELGSVELFADVPEADVRAVLKSICD